MHHPRFAAIRPLILGLATALLVACGGAQQPAAASAEGAASAEATCTTPEVTDPNTPPECPNPEQCEWSAENKKCQPKRGVIMDDARPKPPPPPPPPES